MFRHRFPNVEIETAGVQGSIDLIGDGQRGDLATLIVPRIVNHSRRALALTFQMRARLKDGTHVLLESADSSTVSVPARGDVPAGAAFYLPVRDWDESPFEPEARDERSGRSIRLPYAGRVRSRT